MAKKAKADTGRLLFGDPEDERPVAPAKKDRAVKTKVGKAAERVVAAAPEKPAANTPGGKNGKLNKGKRATAETMAASQREISVSEFFAKNRHLLGFDNPRKALLTAIKEAVDNSLDACEEAEILPDLFVAIKQITEERFKVIVEDNGPGIVKAQVPKIFGQLLYGSKFHKLKMSRGQQGIGISAAAMYGQMTTGHPIRVQSRTGARVAAHRFEIRIDTGKNRPEVVRDEEFEWEGKGHGIRIEIELEARYTRGRQSVDEYLEATAIANPHAHIKYENPEGQIVDFPRATEILPEQTRAIKPHPHGVELGMLMTMARETGAKNLASFLRDDFSRISPKIAKEICDKAGLSDRMWTSQVGREECDRLLKAVHNTRIMAPPTNCLAPIGAELIEKGLAKEIHADFFTSVTRPPSVYRGNPFLIEAGLAWGGSLPAEELIKVSRFANRVPLLYQQSACAMFKGVVETSWRNYGIQQSKGALPTGPMVLFVHIASVWVPFTSESKEAVAHYPEIVRELKLALQECGRKLGGFLRRRRNQIDEQKKRSYIQKYIPVIGEALQEILALKDKERDKVVENLTDVLERSRKM